MEVLNINDKSRMLVLGYIENLVNKGLEYDECINEYRDYLYELETSMVDSEKKLREHIIKVLYLDAIKMCMYTHKTGIVDDKDAMLLMDLKAIESIDDLLAEISSNPDLFSNMIKSARKFGELDNLSKTLVIKSLSPAENYWLSSIVNFHALDSCTYGGKIVLQDIVDELKSNVVYQEKLFGEALSDSNILRIIGVLKSLSLYDRNNGIELLLDIAKVDYSVCKYLTNKVEDSTSLDDHIDYYENYSLDDIIYRLTMDQVFLKSALWMVISLYIDKCYDEIVLYEDILNAKENDEIKKKLVLN